MPIEELNQFILFSNQLINIAAKLSNEERTIALESITKIETEKYVESRNHSLNESERFQKLCEFRAYHKIRMILFETAPRDY